MMMMIVILIVISTPPKEGAGPSTRNPASAPCAGCPTVRAPNKREMQRERCHTRQEPRRAQTYKPRSFQREQLTKPRMEPIAPTSLANPSSGASPQAPYI